MSGLADIAPLALALVVAITLGASFVKGAVGFAMPMIMISGFASFLSPDLALAALILPTLTTNLAQSLRDGLAPAIKAFTDYWRLNLLIMGIILLSAQLVTLLPSALLLAMLGGPIVVFAVTGLMGWQMRFGAAHRRRAEVVTGLISGFFGGFSGVWGPPIIAFLVSLDLPKRENVRVQGVCYLAGSVLLAVAHLRTGVLNAATLPLSALLVVPAFAGQWAGFAVHDRLDQAVFRKATLVVLGLAGLNLIRRAVFG